MSYARLLPQDDADSVREASADQRAMVQLVRAARSEISKRIADVGCMNPDEIKDLLYALIKSSIFTSMHTRWMIAWKAPENGLMRVAE